MVVTTNYKKIHSKKAPNPNILELVIKEIEKLPSPKNCTALDFIRFKTLTLCLDKFIRDTGFTKQFIEKNGGIIPMDTMAPAIELFYLGNILNSNSSVTYEKTIEALDKAIKIHEHAKSIFPVGIQEEYACVNYYLSGKVIITENFKKLSKNNIKKQILSLVEKNDAIQEIQKNLNYSDNLNKNNIFMSNIANNQNFYRAYLKKYKQACIRSHSIYNKNCKQAKKIIDHNNGLIAARITEIKISNRLKKEDLKKLQLNVNKYIEKLLYKKNMDNVTDLYVPKEEILNTKTKIINAINKYESDTYKQYWQTKLKEKFKIKNLGLRISTSKP